ncbi:MAG: hypothetical protein ACRECR_06860, partial [Thermoplasmata archaeon]
HGVLGELRGEERLGEEHDGFRHGWGSPARERAGATPRGAATLGLDGAISPRPAYKKRLGQP